MVYVGGPEEGLGKSIRIVPCLSCACYFLSAIFPLCFLVPTMRFLCLFILSCASCVCFVMPCVFCLCPETPPPPALCHFLFFSVSDRTLRVNPPFCVPDWFLLCLVVYFLLWYLTSVCLVFRVVFSCVLSRILSLQCFDVFCPAFFWTPQLVFCVFGFLSFFLWIFCALPFFVYKPWSLSA